MGVKASGVKYFRPTVRLNCLRTQSWLANVPLESNCRILWARAAMIVLAPSNLCQIEDRHI